MSRAILRPFIVKVSVLGYFSLYIQYNIIFNNKQYYYLKIDPRLLI